jgi:cytochrome c553
MTARVRLLGSLAAIATLLVPALATAAGAPAPPPDGAALYATRCAACHDHAADRIPPKVLISITRSAEDVIDTLTLGVMRTQAAGLSSEQIRSLAPISPASSPRRAAAAAGANPRPAALRRGLSPSDCAQLGAAISAASSRPTRARFHRRQVPHLSCAGPLPTRGAPPSGSPRWPATWCWPEARVGACFARRQERLHLLELRCGRAGTHRHRGSMKDGRASHRSAAPTSSRGSVHAQGRAARHRCQ